MSSAIAKKRILLLDDERAILVPIARYFQNLGCCVEIAEGADEAIALIRERSYDLAMLDVRLSRLGGVEGLEVLRELRKKAGQTRVIMLSAYVSAEVEEEAFRVGADAVLRKPQPLADLAKLAFGLMGEPS
ncbi:MAG TPA: response regulator [Vicinamibacteria bacterium]|nr:response regulator [Vicinamibacteria bacterium]